MVKAGSKEPGLSKTRQERDRQKEFQHDIEMHGGIYVLCRSLEDIQPFLTRTMRLF